MSPAVSSLNVWMPTSNCSAPGGNFAMISRSRSEEHTSELQSRLHIVCRLLLEKKQGEEHCSQDVRRMGDAQSGAVLLQRQIQPALILIFFNDTATTEIYTLSLHDALPI